MAKKIKIEEPKKTIPAFIFGLVFPLIGIFLYTQFTYMGISLYNDVFLGFQTDFSYAIFNWLYSLFKGDVINQIGTYGIAAFIMQPLMQASLMWAVTAFFIGVFIKKLGPMFAVSYITAGILFVLMVIFAAISNSTYGTLTLVFDTDILVLVGGLIVMAVCIPIGGIFGYFAGRD